MNFERFTENQRNSILHLGPLLISAGAGSGKTFTLTSRIVYALSPESDSGIDNIDQILAITFTNKAASEIKSRVRALLREEGHSEQALKVDSAWISTIHGMCQRILRVHALELGLDPAFSVIDDVQKTEILDEALARVLRQDEVAPQGGFAHEGAHPQEFSPQGTHPQGAYSQLFEEYGVKEASSSSSVKAMVLELLKQADYLPRGLGAFEQGPDPLKPSTLARDLLLAYEQVAQEGTSKQAGIATEATAHLQGFLETGSQEWNDFAEILLLLGRPQVSGKAKEAALLTQQQLDRAYLELNLAQSRTFENQLLELAGKVQQEFESLKLEANCIDQSGSIRLVLQAFDTYPEIAAHYQNQFKLVMVDEFQDTNQLQISLIEKLTGKNNEHLCTVGDSQQSIYGFQGADLSVYTAHKADMRSLEVGASYVELKDNFRSHPDVLSFVRTLCGQGNYFKEEFLDLAASRNEEKLIEDGAHYKDTEPRVDVMLTVYSESVEQARICEAQAIVERFSELRAAGHSAGEMVILLGAMTQADIYATAMREAGFDCVVAGGSGFFNAPEVGVVKNLLHALANPANTQALYSILASDLFDLSDDDLLDLVTQGCEEENTFRRRGLDEGLFANGSPACYLPLHDLGAPGSSLSVASRGRNTFVAEALKKAQSCLGTLKPSRIVNQVLIDSGWMRRLEQLGAEGMAVAGNLVKAVRVIEKVEGEQLFDMAQVAQKFGKMHESKESPGALVTDDQNSVRIMTIHSSKGLEFPLVAIAECYSTQVKDTQLLTRLEGERGHLSLKLGKSALKSPVSRYQYEVEASVVPEKTQSLSDFRSAFLQLHREDALAEKRRLFYVALTRASETLIVSLAVRKKKEGFSYEPLHETLLQVLFGQALGNIGFPDEDMLVEFGGSTPLKYRYHDADIVNLETGTGDDTSCESELGVVYEIRESEGVNEYEPSQSQPEPVLFELLEVTKKESFDIRVLPKQKELVSYSSLSADAETYALLFTDAETDESLSVDAGTSLITHNHDKAQLSDADKATDFGSAFHRLAQLTALVSADEASNRMAAIIKTYGVKDGERLQRAFERWTQSEVQKEALTYQFCLPEVSFCVPLVDVVLEGEIDLLSYDQPAGKAFVVDYKTGGSSHESNDELTAKHLFQAQCYAYALLLQGFAAVDLVFVRVEQIGSLQSNEPHVVKYHFATEEIEALRETIWAKRG